MASHSDPPVHSQESLINTTRYQSQILLAGILLAALCAILYELLIGTVSSYLLGNSVTQFSLTIGIFMFAMGVGSYASRVVRTDLIGAFIRIEILLGVVGGFSIAALYTAYAVTEIYQLLMVLFIFIIGVLAGMEIPLILRILRSFDSLRVTVANVLSLDYLGALFASLLFPFLLLPHFGVIRTSILTGLLNIGIAWLLLPAFRMQVSGSMYVMAGIGTSALLLLLVTSGTLVHTWESSMYEDRIIYSEQTPYQKIVITRWRNDVRLFLNGALQFSSIDEYRYHESLVHPALSLTPAPVPKILILGGGDGLVVRELLKYQRIQDITVVDLDPAMTALATSHPAITQLNKHALSDGRVRIINRDAYRFAEQDTTVYDIIIADLPDPNDQSLSKLYTTEFYRLLRHRLSYGGIFITQATSAYFSPHAFWCIVESLDQSGMNVVPYHAYIPTFGDWGFVMASQVVLRPEQIQITVPTRFLSSSDVSRLFEFPEDMAPVDVEPNTLDTHHLLEYYREDWRMW